mmetsp:Transcript_27269/g.80378  ORF Transcript_27269/g.80378 Transcript_27269/m.80378 type:complete len:225 (-) Transcript_27269:588-1262(-)
MSTTRGAAAANSRRVKQRLVQLLFGHKFTGKGREAHRKLDFAVYSYADLRSAYLKRIHDLHPDKKFSHNKVSKKELKSFNGDHSEFVTLQEAWVNYEEVAKMMKRVSKGDEMDANFTLFGVGCSFSDSPEEQKRRSDIMDQAGRGWFTSGLIPEEISHDKSFRDCGGKSNGGRVSLCDDEMFISSEDEENNFLVEEMEKKRKPTETSSRSLIDHMLRPTGENRR